MKVTAYIGSGRKKHSYNAGEGIELVRIFKSMQMIQRKVTRRYVSWTK